MTVINTRMGQSHDPIWTPSAEQVAATRLHAFAAAQGLPDDYATLHAKTSPRVGSSILMPSGLRCGTSAKSVASVGNELSHQVSRFSTPCSSQMRG